MSKSWPWVSQIAVKKIGVKQIVSMHFHTVMALKSPQKNSSRNFEFSAIIGDFQGKNKKTYQKWTKSQKKTHRINFDQ